MSQAFDLPPYMGDSPDHIIAFDNETTGLVLPKTVPLKGQPHIIEFAAVKLDFNTLEEVDRMEFLCRPPELSAITDEIINITKITPDMVKDLPPFVSHFPKLQSFFFGVKRMVAHNVGFDRSMLSFELQRIQKIQEFPWPPIHLCTVERSYDIKGRRMKMGELHEELTGETFEGAHRAMPDVEALVRVIRKLREQARI